MGTIVIIGGGVTGSSTAYHLAMAGCADRVKVIEPDPTYEFAATPRSTGGVRVMFSVPENIRMSLYGHEFYGDFETRMAVDGEPAPIDFRRFGYLYLGQGPEQAAVLEANQRVQVGEGAEVLLLDAPGVASRFPDINVDDVDIAAFGVRDGFIDPYSAVIGFRRKAISLGVEYVRDRAVDFERSGTLVRRVMLESGHSIECDWVVNAANCWAPPLCERVGMPVPVEPMRRMSFWFRCQTEVGQLPLLRHIGASSGGVRSEGPGFLTGYSNYDEPRGFNWDLDHSIFEDILWPALAHRIPAFEAVKVERAWSCHYDQNSLDQNLIIGNWPGHLDNFVVACGMSGHGLQHAPATGRAIKELIVDGGYQTIDLTRFGYQRIIDGEPLAESGPIA